MCITNTKHKTFEGDEIKLVDNFVEDLLSKEDVSVVYVKEVKTCCKQLFIKGD